MIKKLLFTPGPATTTLAVKNSQIVPDICPRENDFSELVVDVQNKLLEMVTSNIKLYECILFGCSGTGAVESVISSVILDHSNLLIINNGAYGKRMIQICEIYNINYTEYNSPSDIKLDLNEIKNFIEDRNITHVAVVHHETTSGILNDIKEIGQLCRLNKKEFIVDAISSFGATHINMEEYEIDYLITSSNKNLQGMAGVGIVISKIESLKKISNFNGRSLYLNLYDQFNYFNKTKQFRFTPPVQTLYALKKAIDELSTETLDGRYLRYVKSWETLVNGMAKLGFKQLVPIEDQSRFICSFVEPESFDFDDFHDFLYERDITIYPGKVLNKNTFRIGTIGDIDYKDIDYLLECVKLYLEKKSL